MVDDERTAQTTNQSSNRDHSVEDALGSSHIYLDVVESVDGLRRNSGVVKIGVAQVEEGERNSEGHHADHPERTVCLCFLRALQLHLFFLSYRVSTVYDPFSIKIVKDFNQL